MKHDSVIEKNLFLLFLTLSFYKLRFARILAIFIVALGDLEDRACLTIYEPSGPDSFRMLRGKYVPSLLIFCSSKRFLDVFLLLRAVRFLIVEASRSRKVWAPHVDTEGAILIDGSDPIRQVRHMFVTTVWAKTSEGLFQA